MSLPRALIKSVGRTVRPNLDTVLRLFDGDFADRVQRNFGITVSRSVSYLAAPVFAAHMQGQVLDTIPVGRHVLLLADLTVCINSALENQPIEDIQRPGEAWVLEVTNPDGRRLAASRAPHRPLKGGDRLLVVATRSGLARLIAEVAGPPG